MESDTAWGSRRLFIAVIPPTEAISALSEQLIAIRKLWPELAWLNPSSWHFTCAFLGQVDMALDDRLNDRLRGLCQSMARFQLGITAAGAFPTPRRARTLWAAADDPSGALRSIALGCREGARSAGIQMPDEPFVGHLSLVRFSRPRDASDLVEACSKVLVSPWLVDEFALVESLLGQGDAGHPRYVVRERFSLIAG